MTHRGHTHLHLLAIGLVALLGLGACSQAQEALGLGKTSPDEFRIVTRQPLAVPPDVELRPPQPGAPRPQEQNPRDRARASVFKEPVSTGGGVQSGPLRSQGEQALLQAAGADDADPDIRQKVNAETDEYQEANSSILDELVFWREVQPPADEVDAGEESKRIREAAAKGESPTEGDTPIIERRSRGILEGVF
ncbi:MAG: DUF3035 domain-containing protein [Chromatiales bacterium]|jgi:hypothetical protein